MGFAMRKFTFILPVAAVLLAAIVVAAEFGAPLSAQSPDATAAVSSKDAGFDGDDDVTAVTWSETSVRVPDSTKPRLPSPKVKLKKKKK
jgi:hypothetical protein